MGCVEDFNSVHLKIPIVYHNDGQTWAAMLYLNPDAPYSTGTSLYAHKNGCTKNK